VFAVTLGMITGGDLTGLYMGGMLSIYISQPAFMIWVLNRLDCNWAVNRQRSSALPRGVRCVLTNKTLARRKVNIR